MLNYMTIIKQDETRM